MITSKVLAIVFLCFCGFLIGIGIVDIIEFLIEERRKKK